MRRQDKYITKGAVWGAVIVSIADVLIQWYEHWDKGEKFTWDNYDGLRTLKNAAIGAAAGGGLGYLAYRFKISEESEIPFNSDEYLRKILEQEHLKTNPALLQRALAYKAELKQWLAENFNDKLIDAPQDTGSFYKRTAIVSSYDLDIILPFKRSSYNSLELMFNDVFETIGKAFGSKAIVKKQSRAIGLTFYNGGDPIHFDVVPGREINDYSVEKDLNLYVNPGSFWSKGSSFKTNVNVQKNITVNKPEARSVIKLLKIYRHRNNLILPTLIIEQCVVNALSSNEHGISSSVVENFLNSLDFVACKLQQRSFFDDANTNNNLNGKLSDFEKTQTVNQVRKDLRMIEDNPRHLAEIFEC